MTEAPSSQTPPSQTPASAADLIDTARYPLHGLETPAGRKLVADSAAALQATGCALLPGFLRPAAVKAMAAEAEAAAGEAFFCDNTHNAYLEPQDDAYPPDHPRRRRLRTLVGSIAYDLLPAASPLRRLYGWDPLVEFIRRVTGRDRLYRLADPIGALSINVFRPGGRHSWHFDEAHYTTTIMLQEAEAGGYFEYLPNLRRAAAGSPDEHAAVGRVLDGDERGAIRLPFAAGTLSLFAGHVSLHRVTEIMGGRLRLVAVLAFAGAPDVVNSDEVRMLFWGRTQPRPGR